MDRRKGDHRPPQYLVELELADGKKVAWWKMKAGVLGGGGRQARGGGRHTLAPVKLPCLCHEPVSLLGRGMKWFQGHLTRNATIRVTAVRHLYQGRYKALVVDGAEGNYWRS